MSRRGIVQSIISFMRKKSASQSSSPSCKFSLLSEAKSSQPKSLLYSAVCVERVPVITNEKASIEEKFSKLLAKVEFENSLLSDHELRLQREAKLIQKRKAEEYEEEDGEGETETALDLEDKWEAEIRSFTLADRITEADRTDNHQSLDRKLDSTLYLLVKQKIEGRDHWVLPQATWEEGESLRQTAERALSSVCGDVRATFLGNAPCAVAKYDPPNKKEEQGIKLFFFKAWYREGTVLPNKRFADDFAWVTKEELSKYCHSGYQNNLKKFLMDV